MIRKHVRLGMSLMVAALVIALAAGLLTPNAVHAAPGAGDADPMAKAVCSDHHIVQAGETLWRIAQRHGVPLNALMNANMIRNPDRIYAGQKLCIPGDSMPPMPMPPEEPKPMPPKPMPPEQPKPMPPKPMPPAHPDPMPEPDPAPPADGCKHHLVMRGDSLSRIAARYGTTVDKLVALNRLPNPNHLYMGQWLKIGCDGGGMPAPPPCGQPCPPSPPTEGEWTGAYYANKLLEGDPVFTRKDAEIRFNWYTGSPGEGIPDDRFSVRWERTVHFAPGHYQFIATSDDGVRVYVDDVLVIDGWKEQPATEYRANAFVHEGNHKVVVEYYEEAGEASIYVRWGMRR